MLKGRSAIFSDVDEESPPRSLKAEYEEEATTRVAAEADLETVKALAQVVAVPRRIAMDRARINMADRLLQEVERSASVRYKQKKGRSLFPPKPLDLQQSII